MQQDNVLLVVFHIVYFTVILYPVKRIVTLDRALERAHTKRMIIILALFANLHFLVPLFLMVAARAFEKAEYKDKGKEKKGRREDSSCYTLYAAR